MKGLDYLITGCARSGTGYLADVVSLSGTYCGHEEMFTVRGVNETLGHAYESSWYGAVHLDRLPDHVKILHIVRDPAKVAGSLYRIGLFAPTMKQHVTQGHAGRFVRKALKNPASALDRLKFVREHRKFFRAHTDIFSRTDEMDRIQAYWFEWNTMIQSFAEKSANPYLRARLEDMSGDPTEILDFLNIRTDLSRSARRNEKVEYDRPGMKECVLSERVAGLARDYGYRC